MASFEFNNPSASSYFVIQTVTTSSDYPVGTPTYMEGVWNVDYIKTYANTTIDFTDPYVNYINNGSSSFSINGINFIFTASVPSNTNDTIYIDVALYSMDPAGFQSGAIIEYSNYYSIPPYDASLIEISAIIPGLDPTLNFFYAGNNQTYGNTIPYSVDGVPGTFSGGKNYNFGLVTSSFVAGVVVQPGYSYFEFIPNITIPVNTIEFRGTGEYTVIITL
jgi:hypothetical protein